MVSDWKAEGLAGSLMVSGWRAEELAESLMVSGWRAKGLAGSLISLTLSTVNLCYGVGFGERNRDIRNRSKWMRENSWELCVHEKAIRKLRTSSC